MLGLLAVIFFSVTGIMLNHDDWFGFATPRIVNKEGTIPEAMTRQPDKLAIVERLRKEFGATGALDSFDIDDDRLTVVFKSPGRRTEATLQRGDGRAEVALETRGFNGRLAELHRTDAGSGWRWVIDGTAVVLLITSVTGLMLWCLVPKWRPLGLGALAVCVIVCGVVYLALVP